MSSGPEQSSFSWLTALPALRGALAADVGQGLAQLRRAIRTEPLQGFELELVGRTLRDLPGAAGGWPSYRVAILASDTAEPIASALRVALLREGYLADIYEAPFRSHRQEVLDPASGLYQFEPDAILVAVSAGDGDGLPSGPMSGEAVGDRLEREVESWRALWRVLGARLGKPVLQHLLVGPEPELLGIAERRSAWTASRFVDALNLRLVEEAPGLVRWLDLDRLAERVGRQNWIDPRLQYHASFGFSPRFLPEYAQLLAAGLRSVLGTAKKALIVDLDNTLWGGVIGDDGLDGIRLGPETAEGAAYRSFCRYVQELGRRGVILGICSKNELALASEVFERHPHMPLRLADFASVRCNWNDKASNLTAMARELNIDLSSLVFVDDNPAEVELIRQTLPQVETVLMEGDPALFVRRLDHQHLFDAQSFSQEDLQRAASYQAMAKSVALQAQAPDLEAYLASLAMTAHVRAAESGDLARLAQMEMKTNQFNLSTRRLSLEQLQEMATAAGTLVLAVSLKDRFADHGLVASLAATIDGDTLVITDWLMSCRVFSRTLEHFVLNHVAQSAAARGLHRIETRFTPTAKNLAMEGVFTSLGFACAGAAPEGPWRYDLAPDRLPLTTFVTAAAPVPQPTGDTRR